MAEHLSDSSQRHPEFGKCCLSGKVEPPSLTAPPPPLRQLLETHDHDTTQFRKHIRQYNAALAFTSLGAKFNPDLLHGGGPYALCLMSGLYHRLGALLLPDNTDPCYAQLYIYDPTEAAQFRINKNSNLDPATMSDL